MEFGAAALSEEDAWFTAFTARTKKVQLVSSKTSALVAAVLKHAFCGPHEADVGGIVLDLAGGTQVRIFIKFELYTGNCVMLLQ